MPLDSGLLARFASLVEPGAALTDPGDIAPHLLENRDKFHGLTRLVLKPKTVEEVSAILKLASETGTPVVPQGGNTGLVGGQIPDMTGNSIILSLTRLNRIREIDPVGNTTTAEAGVI
ncbi:MAG: FAD-binding oxidoreductase, partial [Anaerolineae bacterium]|nr:FAD-binding oxidoreductase [Anaerolineae bacterium]